MFHRILVAVDGSPVSNRGLRTALALAADQGATLYALHVLDYAQIAGSSVGMEYASPSFVEGAWEALREGGRKILLRAAATAAKSKQSLTPILDEGGGAPVADTIVREARKLHVDLIVLGTHGRRGLRRLVMGSDAEGVLREAKVPLLLVRGSARPARAQRAARAPVKRPRARSRAATGAASRSIVH